MDRIIGFARGLLELIPSCSWLCPHRGSGGCLHFLPPKWVNQGLQDDGWLQLSRLACQCRITISCMTIWHSIHDHHYQLQVSHEWLLEEPPKDKTTTETQLKHTGIVAWPSCCASVMLLLLSCLLVGCSIFMPFHVQVGRA